MPELRETKKSVSRVKRVIDGDTFITEDGEKIRMIGVDTPETVHPEKGMQRYGFKAREITKTLIEGKEVTIEKETGNEIDKYGRTLAYVYIGDKMVNTFLVYEGYAYTTRKFQYNKKFEFDFIEDDSKRSKRGLWEDNTVLDIVERIQAIPYLAQKTAKNTTYSITEEIREITPKFITNRIDRMRRTIQKAMDTPSPVPKPLRWIPSVINLLDDTQDMLITALYLAKPLLKRASSRIYPIVGWGLLASDGLNLLTHVLATSMAPGLSKADAFKEFVAYRKKIKNPKANFKEFLERSNWRSKVGFALQAAQVLDAFTGKGLKLGPLMGSLSEFSWQSMESVWKMQTAGIKSDPRAVAETGREAISEWSDSARKIFSGFGETGKYAWESVEMWTGQRVKRSEEIEKKANDYIRQIMEHKAWDPDAFERLGERYLDRFLDATPIGERIIKYQDKYQADQITELIKENLSIPKKSYIEEDEELFGLMRSNLEKKSLMFLLQSPQIPNMIHLLEPFEVKALILAHNVATHVFAEYSSPLLDERADKMCRLPMPAPKPIHPDSVQALKDEKIPMDEASLPCLDMSLGYPTIGMAIDEAQEKSFMEENILRNLSGDQIEWSPYYLAWKEAGITTITSLTGVPESEYTDFDNLTVAAGKLAEYNVMLAGPYSDMDLQVWFMGALNEANLQGRDYPNEKDWINSALQNNLKTKNRY